MARSLQRRRIDSRPTNQLCGVAASMYSTILVPTDFSDCSRIALEQAREIANHFDGELHLLHVIEPWPPAASVTAETYPLYHEYVARENARATGELTSLASDIAGSTRVQHAIWPGNASIEIVNYCEELGIDLVVLGTHGRTGLSRWFMGSVAERVARLAPCPVLIARCRAASAAPTK